MTDGVPTREEALAILHEFTQSDSLRKHALATEAAMRAYARRFGGDEHWYAVVGLLHDFDYERYPGSTDASAGEPDLAAHPLKGSEILRERGIREDIRHAILAHAPFTGEPRDTTVKRAIFAVDELCGFIMAVTSVRPSKKIAEVAAASVVKKLRQKKFAANVSREDITTGAAELGVTLEEHIITVLTAMQGIAADLGV